MSGDDGVSSALELSCLLQDDTPVCLHDCLVVNGTSTSIISIPSRHGCYGVNVWSPARNPETERQLRMGDQHGSFENIKSVQLEETKKVE